jgi:signal transduction protein with GAF and PtsI domain
VIRVQAQLTEDQARRLKALAAEEGVSVAELLRRGAEHVLRAGTDLDPDVRRRRALGAIGRFRDDRDDTARAHDAAFDEGLGS